jgi:AcrR family transcriptional regulator
MTSQNGYVTIVTYSWVRTSEYVFSNICPVLSNCRHLRQFSANEDTPLNKFAKKSELTRTALFSAAQRVIVKVGYEGAQLETIAREAGRTKGSVYAHFRSKEQLFVAMMEFIVAERRRVVSSLSLDQNGEALRQAVRLVCLKAALDDSWLLIILEFKRHAYRNPNSVSSVLESYNQLWDEFHGLLMRLAPHSRRTPEEVSTCLEILRAVTPALPLEPRLRRRPATALRNRRASFEKIFDLLFPPS